jgi:hypothetical protein
LLGSRQAGIGVVERLGCVGERHLVLIELGLHLAPVGVKRRKLVLVRELGVVDSSLVDL